MICSSCRMYFFTNVFASISEVFLCVCGLCQRKLKSRTMGDCRFHVLSIGRNRRGGSLVEEVGEKHMP
jgi:hypothetical protein